MARSCPGAGGRNRFADRAAARLRRKRRRWCSTFPACRSWPGSPNPTASITIRPLTTHADLVRSELLRKFAPLLGAAAAAIGSPQIRARGTVGGNIMNAAACADTVPPLIALGATVTLQSQGGLPGAGAGGPVRQAVPDEGEAGRAADRHSLPEAWPGRPQRLHQAGPAQCAGDLPLERGGHSRNREGRKDRRGAHRARRGVPDVAAGDRKPSRC